MLATRMPGGTRLRYRREIDGLRALAVLPVVAFHASVSAMPGGFLGVDIFFVISGYLITTILLNEHQAGGISILRFYERRIRRILPALFLVMLVSIPFAWMWMLPKQFVEYAHSMIAVPLFGSNILFWQESGYFAQAADLKPFLHTWSLAVEEQFYVFFPLALAYFLRFGRTTVLLLILMAFGASLGLSEYGAHNFARANFLLAPGRAWQLLAGTLCAFYLQGNSRQPESQVLSLLGLLLVVGSILVFRPSFHTPEVITLFPVVGVMLIILFAGPGTWTGRILGTRFLVGIGLISYSLYLWHQPVFAFARIRSMSPLEPFTYVGLVFLSLILATLSWRFVERPFRRGREQAGLFSRSGVFISAATVSAALIIFGGLISAGFLRSGPQRLLASVEQGIEARVEDRLRYSRPLNCEVGPVKLWQTQWHDCVPTGADTDDGRKAIAVAVFGDSHASGLAVGLRLQGYEPFQATGWGCAIQPDKMSPDCRAFFDHAIAEMQEAGHAQEIWLAHHFTAEEMSASALQETFGYWLSAGLPLVFFTQRPEIVDRNNLLLKATLYETKIPDVPDRSLSNLSNWPQVQSVAEQFGVTLVNSDALFCSLTATCAFQDDDGVFLTVDYAHFSVRGADRFMQAALAELTQRGNSVILALRQ